MPINRILVPACMCVLFLLHPTGAQEGNGVHPMAEAVIFSDDFEAGTDDGWRPIVYDLWNVVMDEGDHAYHKSNSDSHSHQFSLIAGLLLGDFDMQLRVKPGEPVGSFEANFTILFGFQDAANTYTMKFHEYAPETKLYREVDGVVTVIGTYTSPILTEHRYYDIRLLREGSRIRIFFEGLTIIDVFDDHFLSGKIALDTPSGKSAYFDDVVIRQPASQRITVTSPNTGETVWRKGDTGSIEWETVDPFDSGVKIELYRGGQWVHTITENTPDDGWEQWTIPVTLPLGTDYRIKISAADEPDDFDFSNYGFNVYAPSTLLFDDFEDGRADGWHPLEPDIWHVVEDEGDLAYYKKYILDYVKYAIHELQTDGSFEWKVTMKSGVPVGSYRAGFAFKFGYQEAGNNYYLKFHEYPPENKLFREVDSYGEVIAVYDQPTITENVYYHLRLRRLKENIKVYYDDALIMDVDDGTWMNGRIALDAIYEAAYFDDIEVSALNQIGVSLPDSSAWVDDTNLIIPITVENLTGLGVNAYRCTVAYDEDVLNFKGCVTSGTLSEAWASPLVTTGTGTFTIESEGESYLSGGGILVYATFDVIGLPAQVSPLQFNNFIFNEDNPASIPSDGSLTVVAPHVPQPDIRISPSAHDFGDINVGSQSTHLFWVINDGPGDLNVYSYEIVGSNDFIVLNGGGPFTVPPSDSAYIVIGFRPDSRGVKEGTLRISNNDLNGNPADVTLSGRGVEPDIDVSPFYHDYGNVPMGSSLIHTFTIRNEGSAVLTVDSTLIIGSDDFNFISGQGTFILSPSGSREIQIAFSPTSSGSRGATLYFRSDDPDEDPKHVPLSGSGLSPEIDVKPASHNFGDVRVDSTQEITFAIFNFGPAPLVVDSVFLQACENYSIVDGGGTFSLNSSESHAIRVSFTPNSQGVTTDTLRIANNDPDELLKAVPLSGRGVVPDISVNPASFDFGNVPVGSEVIQNMTVVNEGTANLIVNATLLVGSGTFQIDAGEGPFTLGPSGEHDIVIRFIPVSSGLHNVSLKIESNDPDENPKHVAITGIGTRPEIDVVPESINFGVMPVGSSKIELLTVSNNGTSELNITNTTIAGAEDFTIVSEGVSFSLAPSESRELGIEFRPSSDGEKQGILRLESNDADENPKDIPLSGGGIHPDIRVTPSSINFGDVPVASTQTQGFVITNEGVADLIIGSTAVSGTGDFEIASGGGSFTLASSETREILIRFSPTSWGDKTDTLRIESNDPDENPRKIPLGGRGIEPDIAVSSLNADYGGVPVGSSAVRTITVSNEGSADLVVTSTIPLGSGDFEISSGHSEFTLYPSGFEEIQILFSPSSSGSKSALLRLESNDPDENPTNIPLIGQGTEPDITVSPFYHDYGNVPVGSSIGKTFTVSNSGTSDLVVDSTVILDAGDFQIASGDLSYTLSPSSSKEIGIQFTPTSSGSKGAILRIFSNDPDENPKDVSLSGGGLTPEIAVTPKSFDYGEIDVDSTRIQNFSIYNYGAAILNLDSTFLKKNADFTIVDGGGPVSLSPSQAHELRIRFNPYSRGMKNDTLCIANNDPDENPKTIPLSGLGIVPDIDISPASVDFESIRIGTTGTQSLTMTNTGNAILMIESLTLMGSETFQITTGEGALTLFPSVQTDIRIRFTPDSPGVKNAVLRILSNDPDEGQTDIPVAGTGTAPEIGVIPESVNFGIVPIGSNKTDTVIVSNEGSADLVIAGLSIVGAEDFTLASAEIPVSLEPSGTHEMTVTFEPSSDGEKNGLLRIESNDADEGMKDVPLTGGGTQPDIQVIPSSHDYGEVPIDSSRVWTFSITNEGVANLNVFSTTIDGPDAFIIAGGGGSFTLVSSETREIQVRFTPSYTGPVGGILHIISNDPDEATKAVSLNGRGTEPDIAVSPESRDFGAVPVGSFVDEIFTVHNDGIAPLSITAIRIEGPGDFIIVSGGDPLTLARGQSFECRVQFQPYSAGLHQSILVFESNDADENPAAVPLTGIGLRPDIDVAPSSYDFGEVYVDSTRVKAFTVKNEGPDDLVVHSTTLLTESAGFSIVSGAGPFTLSHSESREIRVQFNPSSPGHKSDTLRIESNDSDENPALIQLTGVGIEPDISVHPQARDYGVVSVGSSKIDTFIVSNEGSAGLVVSEIMILGSGDFIVVHGDDPFTLEPSQAHEIHIAFQPSSEGLQQGTLRIVNTDRDENPKDISLSGGGTQPDISVSPLSRDYGDVPVNTGHILSISITNEGPAELVVYSMALNGSNGFSIVSENRLGALAYSESEEVRVQFQPHTSGLKRDSLRVVSNDPDENPVIIPLSGRGIEPDIAVSPTLLDFGGVPVVTSTSDAITITNQGNADLVIDSTRIIGSDAFLITDQSGPLTIQPSDKQELGVAFHPQSTGPKTATMHIYSNDINETLVDVSLHGTGIIVSTSPPLLASCYPANAAQSIPRNSWIAFEIRSQQGGMQVDKSTLQVDVNGLNIVTDGTPETDDVDIVKNSTGYRLLFKSSEPHTVNHPLNVTVHCEDGGYPASIMDSTYTFSTGNAWFEITHIDTVGETGGIVIDDLTDIALTFPPDALGDDVCIATGLLDSLPGLPDSLRMTPLGPYHAIWPFGFNTDSTISVDLPYSEEMLNKTTGQDPAAFTAYAYSTIRDAWSELEITGIDRDQLILTVKTNELTYFTLAYDANASTGIANAGQQGQIATTFTIVGNYPNPFNSETTIEYRVQKKTHITLHIFDILGRRVRTLINEVVPGGTHSIVWDGKDENGQMMGSGLYFYVMRSEDHIEKRKTILLK